MRDEGGGMKERPEDIEAKGNLKGGGGECRNVSAVDKWTRQREGKRTSSLGTQGAGPNRPKQAARAGENVETTLYISHLNLLSPLCVPRGCQTSSSALIFHCRGGYKPKLM